MRDILAHFLEDLAWIKANGGRVVCYHLEFDGSIIAQELNNAGLVNGAVLWTEMAKKCVCTMNPDVGGWVQACKGRASSEMRSTTLFSLWIKRFISFWTRTTRGGTFYIKGTQHTPMRSIAYIEMRKLVAEALRLSSV